MEQDSRGHTASPANYRTSDFPASKQPHAQSALTDFLPFLLQQQSALGAQRFGSTIFMRRLRQNYNITSFLALMGVLAKHGHWVLAKIVKDFVIRRQSNLVDIPLRFQDIAPRALCTCRAAICEQLYSCASH